MTCGSSHAYACACVVSWLQASDQYLLEGLKRLCEAALAEVRQATSTQDSIGASALYPAFMLPEDLERKPLN